MNLLNRVRNRIPDSEADDNVCNEYIATVTDRLCLRLGVDTLPVLFESICVDSVVKMVRRKYYEGISSESAANLSTSFVNDILDEYSDEISMWKENNNKAKVKLI